MNRPRDSIADSGLVVLPPVIYTGDAEGGGAPPMLAQTRAASCPIRTLM
jgi:hypothetical protein